MARNSEKAQSMLYRFRESQAIEMGLGSRMKGERRPRMASSVTNLRECERWRGDILRDISRKVAKIQDSSLTDYEIRDLNDEINQLMREKRHYETQIVNLGGANYKRGNQAMTDDEGREVPGTRGYKYFGRAKELPGVKEMFTRGAQQASEESARNASFQMFRNQGPDYYGDNDEIDGTLAEEEDALAREDWQAAVAQTASILSLPEDIEIPYPTAKANGSHEEPEEPEEPEETGKKTKAKGKGKSTKKGTGRSKRKADTEEEPEETEDADEGNKKAKLVDGATVADGAVNTDGVGGEEAAKAAALAASFLGVLDLDSLKMPVVPTREQMGEILLEVRKKALREEYGV